MKKNQKKELKRKLKLKKRGTNKSAEGSGMVGSLYSS